MISTVSVLIPCFNCGKWIGECIDSIQVQSYPALEIVIVDDGSSDDETKTALGIIEAASKARILRKSNGGVSSARNMALDAARGDFVLFLDADDYLEPHALQVMVQAAEMNSAEFVGAGWRDVSEDGAPMRSTAPHRVSKDPYANIVAGLGLATGGVLVKRRTEFRFKDTMPWEVLEYFLDYVSLGAGAVLIDDVVVNRRQGDRRERLTIKLDHFEPGRMGAFLAGRKDILTQNGMATEERIAALDVRILNSVQALLRQRRVEEAEILANKIERPLLKDYSKYRLGSFAWTFRWGGFAGARFFVEVNRLIGRA